MAREPIQQTVERLAHTSGGRILASARDGLRRSLKYYVALFLVGFMLAFPLSSEFIKWLIRDSRLPAEVQIIVISPVEFLLLQLRIAGYTGLILVSFCLLYTSPSPRDFG